MKQNFFDDLTTEFPIHRELPRLIKKVYYDSFDWRLFKKGLTLIQSENQLSLCRLSDGRLIHHLECKTPPVFSADLSEGSLKEKLSETLNVRALLTIFETKVYVTKIRVLDSLKQDRCSAPL